MTTSNTIKVDATDYPVSSVTIFRFGRTEVVRTFDLTLQAGENDVEIIRLPSCLDPDSIRVSGLGAVVRIVDVACKVVANTSYESDTIHSLRMKKHTLEEEKLIRQQGVDIYIHYGKNLSAAQTPPEQIIPFLETFVEARQSILNAMNQLDEQIRDVDQAMVKERKRETAGKTGGKVNLKLMAAGACQISLRVTYLVSGVSWKPIYEIHANTQDNSTSSSIRLHYRAHIAQSTGEDWNNTTLTLSTSTQSGLSLEIPQLPGYKIRRKQSLWPPQPRVAVTTALFGGQGSAPQPAQGTGVFGNTPSSQQASPFGAFGSTSAAPTNTIFVPPEEAPASDVPSDGTLLTEGKTLVQSNSLSSEFVVEGHANIPSDGATHTVSIAALDFEAKMTRVTVPRISSTVYMQCTVRNTSDYQLLPGPVSIFADDRYVSKTDIRDVAPGDTFECALGVDNNVRVIHERKWVTLEPTRHNLFVSDVRKTIAFSARTTVQNKHQFIVPSLIVKDALPTREASDSQTVNVNLTAPVGLAEAKDGEVVNVDSQKKIRWSKIKDGKGGEKDGKYEWIVQLNPGQELKLDADWNVKVPHDSVNWEEHTVFP